MIKEFFQNKKEYSLELWIGWITLLVTIISSYLPEGKKFSLFPFLFIFVSIILIMKAYFKNEIVLVDHENKLHYNGLLILSMLIEYYIIWYFFGFFVAIVLYPNTELTFLILWGFILVLLYIDLYKNKLFKKMNEKEYRPNYNFILIISCLILLILIFLFKLVFVSFNIIFVEWVLIVSQISPLILMVLIFSIFKLLAQLLFVYSKYKRLFLLNNLQKIKLNKIIHFVMGVVVLLFFVVFVLIQPNIGKEPNSQVPLSDCVIEKTYLINEDPFLINLTMYSIPDKNYLNIQLYLNSILVRHGDFNRINVTQNSDKSLNQYFEVISAKEAGFVTIRFYNKDIYKMYNLELVVDENICE